MPRITISWRTFSFNYPPIVEEKMYWTLKDMLPLQKSNYLMPSFNIWKPMKFEIIYLTLSIIFIIWAIPQSKETWFWDAGLLIFGLGGAICLIGFIISFYNFIENYIDQRNILRF